MVQGMVGTQGTAVRPGQRIGLPTGSPASACTERSRWGCRRGWEEQKGAPGLQAALLHKSRHQELYLLFIQRPGGEARKHVTKWLLFSPSVMIINHNRAGFSAWHYHSINHHHFSSRQKKKKTFMQNSAGLYQFGNVKVKLIIQILSCRS